MSGIDYLAKKLVMFSTINEIIKIISNDQKTYFNFVCHSL